MARKPLGGQETAPHEPIRSCIACGAKGSPRRLWRFTLNTESAVQKDGSRKAAGRGAYVCKREECVQKALKSGAFNRSFKKKISVPPGLLDELRAALQESET